jgi:hypothetical protein
MCNGELLLYDKYKTIQVDEVSCLHVHSLINTVSMLYDVNFVGVFMVLPEPLFLGSGGSDTLPSSPFIVLLRLAGCFLPVVDIAGSTDELGLDVVTGFGVTGSG